MTPVVLTIWMNGLAEKIGMKIDEVLGRDFFGMTQNLSAAEVRDQDIMIFNDVFQYECHLNYLKGDGLEDVDVCVVGWVAEFSRKEQSEEGFVQRETGEIVSTVDGLQAGI